ncbi:unnamed protein product, partial [Rotaria magnacalcarata]
MPSATDITANCNACVRQRINNITRLNTARKLAAIPLRIPLNTAAPSNATKRIFVKS